MLDLRPWTLLALLSLLNILNFADRFLMVGLAPSIMADLELTNFQYTLLTGIIFTAFYTVCGLFMGVLADRVHRPRLIAAGLTVWTLLTAASGATRNFAELAAARLFIGVGESTATPASLAMLSDKFDEHRRGLASSIYYLGVPVGSAGAFIFASVMEPLVGWRACFYLLGATGLVLAVLLLFLKDPIRGASEQTPASAPARPRGLGEIAADMLVTIRTTPALVFTILGGMMLVMPMGAAALDILWLISERGFEQQRAQQIGGACFLVGGILGGVLGGTLSDRSNRRHSGGRMRFLFRAYLLFTPLAFGYRLVPGDSALFIPAALLAAVGMMMPFGPLMAAVQDLSPPRVRATAVALLVFCLALVGQGLGSAVAGLLADGFIAAGHTSPYTSALLFGTLPLLAALPLLWLASRQYAGDRARMLAQPTQAEAF